MGREMERPQPTSPDALFTPKRLAAHICALNGGQRGPSVKSIRTAIRSGDLRASLRGKWWWVRWQDWLDHIEAQRVRPVTSESAKEWAAQRLARERRA